MLGDGTEPDQQEIIEETEIIESDEEIKPRPMERVLIIRKGKFKKGIMNSKGTQINPDGTIWKGEFKKDLLQGEGKVFYNNGITKHVEFKDNNIFREIEESEESGKKYKNESTHNKNGYYGASQY